MKRIVAFVLLPLTVGVAATFGAMAKSADAPAPATSKIAFVGASGKMQYAPYDAKGDTLPDFSVCGYKGGGVALPDAPVKATLAPQAGTGDDTARIQAGLDTVSALPLDAATGLRGAVVLQAGTFRVGGPLFIRASGVVLRGSGPGENGTLVMATGSKAYSLVTVAGGTFKQAAGEAERKVTETYVSVGAKTVTVADATGLKIGGRVILRRNSNEAFIHALGMDSIAPRASDPKSTVQWKPFTLFFDRTITKIDGNKLTLDAPLTCAIDAKWGGGSVARATDTRIQNVGVENLRVESAFDKTVTAKNGGKTNFADEKHAEYVVRFDHVCNAWARNISARYMAHGVAEMSSDARSVTVQDCQTFDLVSIITGGRRYPYNISGQLCLVQRCFARDARHAFVVGGGHVCGPNVFLDCRSESNHATSEPHQRWSVGGLYDNVQAGIAFQDRQWMGTGHGWSGANCVAWNCTGSLVCQRPPTAQNFAIGFVGKRDKGAFTPRPDGWWESEGALVAPRSLYLQQLKDRLGETAVKNTLATPGTTLPPLPPPYK